MVDRRRRIPDGVQDTNTIETYNKQRLERAFREIFFAAGYDEVETPLFEYIEVFQRDDEPERSRDLIKWIDSRGDILALRPDMTTPIARMTATSAWDEEATRLCYIANSYGAENAYYSSQREYSQAGVELLGDAKPTADAEVIAMSITLLRRAGLSDFQIDIGQVDFFKGLLEEAGLSEKESEELRVLVDRKDDLAVELFFQNISGVHTVNPDIVDTIRRLPMLYGGEEVFDAAVELSSSPRCLRAIENLRQIYELLASFGLSEYISVDLGMLQANEYYSGLIFKGYCDELGVPIVSGGRYDELLERFGRSCPATGFALGMKRVLIALDAQKKLQSLPGIAYVIGADPACLQKAYALAENYRADAVRCLLLAGCSQEEIKQKAERLGAQWNYIEEERR